MPKQPSIQQEGTILEVLPNAMFRVKLDNDHIVIAYTGGKMVRHNIKMTEGDRVKITMSPYDLNRGRIVYRCK